MEIDKNLVIRATCLAAGVINFGAAMLARPEQVAAVSEQPTKDHVSEIQEIRTLENIVETSITNKRGETTFTRNFVGGDIFIVMSRKLRIKDSLRDFIYDLSFTDRGLVVAAIRAKTPIEALSYTTYPELAVSGAWLAPKKDMDFTDVITEQLKQAQIPGVACNVGCNMIHLAAFDARDVEQQNGTKVLQLLRIRNQRVIG